MIDKNELGNLVFAICNDILDECVSPVMDIPKGSIWADPMIADIGCYTFGDEKEEDEIINKICMRYKLVSMTHNDMHMVLDKDTLKPPEDYVAPIDAGMPLALMALYIIMEGVLPNDLIIGDEDDE